MCPAHYIAEPSLKIDGQSAPDNLMEDILQFSIEESLHLPDMFTLVLRNSYLSGNPDDNPWPHEKLLEIGKTIKVSMGSSTMESQEFEEQVKGDLFEGEITGLEAHFTSGSQAPIVVRGYDISHRLQRGRHNRSFQNMTDSDILKKIVGEAGVSANTVDDSGAPHDYVFQENQTNMEFLRERCARNGFELFVQDGKINFRKPNVDDSIELTWLRDLTSFRVRVTSAEQVESVEVRGWDYQKKEQIVATKSSAKVLTETDHGEGKKASGAFENLSSPKMVVVDQPVFTSKEADTMAQALLDELGSEFVQADAKAEGNPDIRPGRVVKLKNMGKYSGEYYVTETRHLYRERVYTTEFSVRGLRGTDLLSTLSPPTHLKPGQTLLVGRVTNNKDPEGWGRVRVELPTLTQDHESNWARVIGIGAGPGRGLDCLPEVQDEVLVAFEHGDIHRPYVIGGVWNGKDAPPESVDDTVVDGKVRLRTLKTRTGHTLQFVEEDKGGSEAGVYVDTVYGHHLYLNDSKKFIEIKTKDGHTIRLDDQGKKIEVKSKGKHSLVMNDTAKSITLDSAGSISISAKTTLDLSGSAAVTVKGGVIKLN